MKAIYGIGHSNRTLEFVIGLLLGYEVKHLIDIRRMPQSRYNPQFNKGTFAANLETVGIHYTHMPGLGGMRRPRPDSPNRGWSNSNFRGFADYMQTEEFEMHIERLIAIAKKETTAFMCAEAVPWRCHRSLIADALVVRGLPVHQIMSRVSAPTYQLTPFAQVEGTRILYPPKHTELAL